MRLFSCSYSNVQTIGLEGKPEVRDQRDPLKGNVPPTHTWNIWTQKGPMSDALEKFKHSWISTFHSGPPAAARDGMQNLTGVAGRGS